VKKMRYRLRTLLVGISLFAICLACSRVYDHWYAQRYSAHYLFSLLHNRIHDEDTFQQVATYFQTATKTDPSSANVKMIWSSRSWVIQPGDEIWHFKIGSSGVYLQFRDGKVVNHQNRDFAYPDDMAQRNHGPVPPTLLRYGIWPICLCATVAMGSILVAIKIRSRLRHRPSTDNRP